MNIRMARNCYLHAQCKWIESGQSFRTTALLSCRRTLTRCTCRPERKRCGWWAAGGQPSGSGRPCPLVATTETWWSRLIRISENVYKYSIHTYIHTYIHTHTYLSGLGKVEDWKYTKACACYYPNKYTYSTYVHAIYIHTYCIYIHTIRLWAL